MTIYLLFLKKKKSLVYIPLKPSEEDLNQWPDRYRWRLNIDFFRNVKGKPSDWRVRNIWLLGEPQKKILLTEQGDSKNLWIWDGPGLPWIAQSRSSSGPWMEKNICYGKRRTSRHGKESYTVIWVSLVMIVMMQLYENHGRTQKLWWI